MTLRLSSLFEDRIKRAETKHGSPSKRRYGCCFICLLTLWLWWYCGQGSSLFWTQCWDLIYRSSVLAVTDCYLKERDFMFTILLVWRGCVCMSVLFIAWLSGRTSVVGRWTYPVLCL